MFRNKKGVSPVIAVVLMIVVAVAISLVVYVWASGFVSEKTGAETKAGDYSFLWETKAVDNTNIRNTGNAIAMGNDTAPLTSAEFLAEFDVYINNTLSTLTNDLTIQNAPNETWDKGEVITIDFTGDAVAGDKIKIVHKESGTPIVFTLE